MVYPIFQGTPSGLILQYQDVESDTSDFCGDDEVNWNIIKDMNLSITTRGSSYIKAKLSLPGYILAQLTAALQLIYNVTLIITGIEQKFVLLIFSSGVDSINNARTPINVNIEIKTDTLPAGTYGITAYWKSRQNLANVNRLYSCYDLIDAPRTLSVQEISA